MKEIIQIAIVDDDITDRQLVRITLEKAMGNIEITEIGSKKELVKLIKKQSFHIIITDYNLKGSTGLEVVDHIRKKDKTTAIIMLTGEGNESIAIEALKLGVDQYVIKTLQHIKTIPGIIDNLVQIQNKDRRDKDKSTASGQDIEHNYAHLVRVFDHSALGMVLGDHTGNVLEINNTACQMVGYTKEELKGVYIKDITHPDDLQKSIHHHKKLFAGEIDSYTLDKRYIHKNGHAVWVEVNASLVRDNSGNPQYAIAQIKDVTEHKKTEQELQNIATGISAETGEAFFHSLTKHLADTLDVDYAIISNIVDEENVQSVSVYSHGEYLDQLDYKLASSPCENVKAKHTTKYISGVQKHYPKFSLLAELDIEGYLGTPLINSSGQVIGLIVILNCKPLENIEVAESMLKIFGIRATAELERLKAESDLHNSEERTRYILRNAMDAFVTINKSGEITDWNKKAEETFGWSLEEAIEKNISDLIIPEDQRQAHIKGMERLNKTKIAGPVLNQLIEVQALHQKGHTFPVELSISPIIQGDEIAYSAFIRDITERKFMETLRNAEMEILESISSGTSQKEVLTNICLVMEKQSQPEVKASILILDDVNNILTLGAAPSFSKAAQDAIDGMPIGECNTSCGTAVYRKEPVYVADVQNDPLWAGFYEFAAEHHIAACWSTPIFTKDGQCLGSFALSYPVPSEPTESSIELMTLAARLTGNAIERQVTLQALEHSEQKFAKAFSSCPDAIAITTLDEGYFVEVNDTFVELTGYSREEIMGKRVEDFNMYVNPADREDMIAALKNDHKVRNVIAPIRRRSGEIGIAELSAELVEFNKQTCLLAMVRDVTEQERAKETLKNTEEQLRLLLDSTAEAIYGVDLDGNCTFANAACINALGFKDQDELLGQYMHRLMHHTLPNGERYRNRDCRIYKAYSEGKGIQVDDEIFWRADGSSFAAEYWSNPVYKDNKLVGCVVNFIDITERLDKESELLHAQKMEVMGQLTGGIAHDFNNLLTIIIGNLKFLRDEIEDDLNEEDLRLIDAALTAAWDGADLTHGLLAVSRKQLLQPKNIEINAAVDDFIYMIGRTLGANINISFSKYINPVNIFADPTQLKNALFNLAINARDAMPNGGNIKIDAHCEKLDGNSEDLQQGQYVIISIIDTGTGMTEEEITKVFDPFYSTKESGRGTGLGLSTVYGFTKQSGGKTKIISAPGKGTTVSVYLPTIDSDSEISLDDSIEEEIARGTETILVTEDESGVRMLAVKILKKFGYNVLEAENADAAIKIINSGNNIDLLFSDIMMPGKMSGHDLSNWVAENYPDIKIVLTTGFDKKSLKKDHNFSTSFPVLHKPYSKSQLALNIRSTLDQ